MVVANESKFIQIFIAIIWGWLLISLLIATTNAFTYSYLGLNPNSFKHTFWVFIIASIAFLLYVFLTPASTQTPENVITRMSSITKFAPT